jgi:tRNA-splicing ligase RtcB
MFVIFEPGEQRVPIKVWLDNQEQIEPVCFQQAKNLSNLPYIHQWVALMPDAHSGYGMPIGGVIATKNVIIPNAVGVDIGCGVDFVQSDLPVEPLLKVSTPDGKLADTIVGEIMRTVPVGFKHNREKQTCSVIDDFLRELSPEQERRMPRQLMEELEDAYYQVGSLGSGNHFIELQTDDRGRLGIMVHSGSQNLGKKICDYFNNEAKKLNRQAQSSVPPSWDLAYLRTDSETGRQYLRWMKLAQDFARQNRDLIMQRAVCAVRGLTEKYADVGQTGISETISCHHNYASLEEHYGELVWVHRKGAIRAGRGEMGIIPGAMGTFSYLVSGKGNPESFSSCSHGAGRRMSRAAAKKQYSPEKTIGDLKSLGVFLGKNDRRDIGEECRFAYKEIDFVIVQELDLIEVVRKVKTIAVIKG